MQQIFESHLQLSHVGSQRPQATRANHRKNVSVLVLKFDLEVAYKPAKEMYVSDTLSRAYTTTTQTTAEIELAEEIDVTVHTLLHDTDISLCTLVDLKAATADDPTYSRLRDIIRHGFPSDVSALPSNLRCYHSIVANLNEVDGVLLHEGKVLVPDALNLRMLAWIHEGHGTKEVQSNVNLLSGKTAASVIVHIKSIFSRHGIPEEIVVDNMPFNSLEMRRFAGVWNCHIVTFSPHFVQFNGQTERCIRTVKLWIVDHRVSYVTYFWSQLQPCSPSLRLSTSHEAACCSCQPRAFSDLSQT
jgi:hypothetical protein